MNINRYNYEEFFILYMDNELDAEGRREVENFVQQNPDLKDELDILMQSKLTPDTDISFADKGSLLRFDSSSINLANYEEWLTTYVDNELTEDKRKNVEEFVAMNPAIQKELNLLQQAKLEPEAIVFPYKESLYRTTEKARVISIRWKRIAVAAVLLLAFGTTTVVLMNNNNKNNNTTNGPVIAQTDPGKAKVNNTNNTQPVAGTPTNEPVASDGVKQNDESNDVKETRGSNLAAKQVKSDEENTKQDELPIDKKDFIAKEEKIVEPPQSGDNVTPNNHDAITTEVISGITTGSLTTSKEKINEPGVTPSIVDSYNNGTRPAIQTQDPVIEKAEGELASNDNGGNKGLRGFFRKVTRTIEKRTNIKATDDDDRLLIAGLAIKMN